MTEEKRKPGRPRKWSSDAERMRAARAVKRERRLADEERREAKRAERERANREQFAPLRTRSRYLQRVRRRQATPGWLFTPRVKRTS